MKNYTITLIFFITSLLSAQSQFQEFINKVNSLSNPTDKIAVVDSFMIYARTKGIPFIENLTANFIYNGNVSSLAVAGDFNGWSTTGSQLTKLSGTNFWYRSYNFESNARLDYKFVLNGSNWILDPENPKTCNGGFGPNSELAMPGYIQPWEIKFQNGIQHGSVTAFNLASTNTSSTYQIKIYLPPGYNSQSNINYPVVYFQDGYEYIDLAYANNVLDNLIDSGKIAPVIGVFVRPTNRNEEYAYTKRNSYRLFFVNELVPYIDANYKTINDASKRVVLGDSFGGNISALIGFNHPDVFGNVGLHSAAFWPNNYETYNQIISQPKKNIKWVSIWGTYESLYTNMRNFKDTMISKGYEYTWLELPEGHSWGLWRANIDLILETIFPPDLTSVENNEFVSVNNFILFQNYPNPFNPVTEIRYQIEEDRKVNLTIYDLLGNEVATLVNDFKKAGNHNVKFNASKLSSGIYFYKLTAGDFVSVKKMMLLK